MNTLKKILVLVAFGAMSAMTVQAVGQAPMLIVDYDRDGTIGTDDRDRALMGEPFTIWLNDDDDAAGAESDEGNGDTNNDLHDIPGGEDNDRDCEDDQVNGRCDLLDFFPVLADVNGVEDWADYDWKLISKSVNLVFTRLKTDTAGDFHTKEVKDFSDETPLYKATVAKLADEGEEGVALPDGFLVDGRGVIIVEGAALGDEGLTLRGTRGDGASVEVTLDLRVTNVESLYGWMNLRSTSPSTSPSPSPSTSNLQPDDRHFVLVHGYNTNHEEARGNAAEFYKKLWQSGSNARFTAVEWRGDQSQVKFDLLGINFTPNYFVNAENAFAAAGPFAEECQKLPGEKILVGHSLGNLLISSAIKDHGLDYMKFVMLNAAIAREAFDARASDEDMVDDDWLNTEEIPLLDRASHWHTNFADRKYDPDDYRRKLAWRGRFANLQRTVNFYSPTDNVLLNPDPNEKDPDKYDEDKVFLEYEKRLVGTAGQQKTGFGFWAFSEKMKGTWVVDVVNAAMEKILEVSEADLMKREGGWGENIDFEEDKPFDPANTRFTPFLDGRMKTPDALSLPSDEANRLRAQHLADAIPAESFAAGANPVETLENVNLESFIGENPIWPIYEGDGTHTNEWKHSTFREVAFYHTSKLYASLCRMGKTAADTVVYGTIRTAEKENPVAEAIAIRNGKFVYVGDEAGVAACIGDETRIIDHRGKGMVMPGCTDGHSHYVMQSGLVNMKGGIIFDMKDTKEDILRKVADAAQTAKRAGKTGIFGFGWNFIALRGPEVNPVPTVKDFDEITEGLSMVIFAQGGHHAYCNSECLRRCGIIDGEGNVLIKKIDGGLLELDEKGYPTGFANERVTGFLMRMGGIDYDEIIDDEAAKAAILETRDHLLSTGYTIALEGWSNMLHPRKLYEAANWLDNEGKLNFVFPMTYEIEPWQTDIDTEIAYLDSLNKSYRTRHVLPEYLKVFMDGCVESMTGAMIETYKDGTLYKSFWPVERLADITEKCNAKGLTVHTHVMGDAAVKETTDAYIQGGDKVHRNCLVHLRHVREADFQRFAANNIACAAGLTWHVNNGKELNDFMAEFIKRDYIEHAYPIESLFDAGVKVSSHSDFPANAPSPQDPFGIMEVAVTGQMPDLPAKKALPALDEDELITREQAFEALTINGAWQVGLENERGSISVGKWADFVLADQDVFQCAATDIGNTKVVSTWFEGEKVFEAPEGSPANPWKIGETGHETEVTAWTDGATLVVEGAGAIGSMPWAGAAAGIANLVKADGVGNVKELVESLPDLKTVNGLKHDEFMQAALGFVRADGFSAIAVEDGEAKLDVVTLRSDALGEQAEWIPVSTNRVTVPAPGETGFFCLVPKVDALVDWTQTPTNRIVIPTPGDRGGSLKTRQ